MREQERDHRRSPSARCPAALRRGARPVAADRPPHALSAADADLSPARRSAPPLQPERRWPVSPGRARRWPIAPLPVCCGVRRLASKSKETPLEVGAASTAAASTAGSVVVKGAREHNLKGVDLTFP